MEPGPTSVPPGPSPSASEAPQLPNPSTKKKKTTAQRRAQAKRAAERVAAGSTSAAGPLLPTLATAATAASAAVAPCPVLSPRGTPASPRDLSALSHAGAHPWRGLRRRKRRMHHPHRHERRARDETRMWPVHPPELEFRTTRDPLHDSLRTACFAALSPLYQYLRRQGLTGRSWATPDPEPVADHLPGYHSVMEREDDELCWPEILHLVTLGAQAINPHDPGAGPATMAMFSSLPSWWREELLAAHSFLVQSSAVFADRYLDRAQQCYMLGLALWFLEPAG